MFCDNIPIFMTESVNSILHCKVIILLKWCENLLVLRCQKASVMNPNIHFCIFSLLITSFLVLDVMFYLVSV